VRRVVTVFVVVVAILGVGLVLLDRATSRDGDEVLILGDSITAWGAPALQSSLGGPFHLQVVGHGGYRTDPLEPDAVAAAATSPTQVIINAGTNDALQHRAPADAIADLERMVSLFPKADCVHVVTINTHMRDPDGQDQAGAQEINDAIRAMPDHHTNVSVIDWADVVDGNLADHPPRGSLTPDTIHPGPEGERVLISNYDRALQRCGRPWRFW
jgi:lysophospholipase L1-like esterase